MLLCMHLDPCSQSHSPAAVLLGLLDTAWQDHIMNFDGQVSPVLQKTDTVHAKIGSCTA